jgi:RNA polymerase sigma-70 factor (ECF subfamily)
VKQHQEPFLRLARVWVRDAPAAEDVVRDAWMTALESLDRFEGRSSLRTWLYRILIDVARMHPRARQRMVPMSSLLAEEASEGQPSVEAERFLPQDHRWAGHWAVFPESFSSPDPTLERDALRALLETAIGELPPVQQQVMVLCDVEGLTGEEVSHLLGVTDPHQRVLLHRARSTVRARLERQLAESEKK